MNPVIEDAEVGLGRADAAPELALAELALAGLVGTISDLDEGSRLLRVVMTDLSAPVARFAQEQEMHYFCLSTLKHVKFFIQFHTVSFPPGVPDSNRTVQGQ